MPVPVSPIEVPDLTSAPSVSHGDDRPRADDVSIESRDVALPRRIRPIRLVILLLVTGLTIAPILRVIRIAASTGANVLSDNDTFLTPYIPTYDRILSGTYDWSHFFHDTFIVGSHAVSFPFLVRLAIVKLSNWNVYWEDGAAILMACCTVLLLHAAFTRAAHRTVRLAMWPVLTWMVFSTSQLTMFVWGDAGLTFGLAQLGAALAVWGLVRFRARPNMGVAFLVAGGLLASWSAANGVLVWAAGGLLMVLLGYRRWTSWVAAAAGAAVAAMPYILYLDPSSAPNDAHGATLLDAYHLVAATAYPLTQDFSVRAAFPRGLATIFLLAVLGTTLMRRRGDGAVGRAAPGIAIAAVGLLNIAVVSAFRDEYGPWYATPFMAVWLGIVGIALATLPSTGHARTLAGHARELGPATLAGVMLVAMYATSNVTWEDKVAVLDHHSPATASCLRNYETSLDVCRIIMFVSKPDPGEPDRLVERAAMLERHELSVFGPRQSITMQGDTVLRTQRQLMDEDDHLPRWVRDRGTKRQNYWLTYKHLNLLLPAGGGMYWPVSIPADVETARFDTAVAPSRSMVKGRDAGPVTIEVYIAPVSDIVEPYEKVPVGKRVARVTSDGDWRDVDASLARFAGQDVAIQLRARAADGSGSWAVLRYPQLRIQRSGS